MTARNKYNGIPIDPKNKYNAVSPTVIKEEEPKVPAPEVPRMGPMIPRKQTVAEKYGLPEATISQADPDAFKKEEKEPSLWNKIARAVLPKGAEEYFGLSQPELSARDRVMEHEKDVQSYYRGKRREENIKSVDMPVEEYTAPTTFWGKLQDSRKHGNYAKNVWSGFIKPAIGTTAEQIGLSIDSPKIRDWGEKFADRVLEEESRRASAQSMADVPSIFEGGLKDPRYYSKTMTQAIGFFTAVLGSSIAVTAATKNPAAGAVAGYGVGASLESSNAYRSMLDKGVAPDDANTAAQIYGVAATMIENSTGIRPAGGTKAMVEDFAVHAAKDKAIKNFFKKWAEEGILEEGSQQLVENVITKFVDNNTGVFDDVLESMVSGTVGALPLAGGGAVISNKKVQRAIKDKQIGLTTKDISGEETFYSGENGQVAERPIDMSKERVVTIQGDQKALTNSKSYVEADQKLYEQYAPEYDFIKIEHPEMPNKPTEYYDLVERKWYSKDPAVAEAYAMQARSAKYDELKLELDSMIERRDALEVVRKGNPGDSKIVKAIEKLNKNIAKLEKTVQATPKTLFSGKKPQTGAVLTATEPAVGQGIPKSAPVIAAKTPMEEFEASLAESDPRVAEGDSALDAGEEIREEAVKNLEPDVAETIEPLEKVVGADKRTPLNQRVRWIDYLRTPWRVFERMGIRPAYQKLLAGYTAYVQELPQNIDKITEWSKRVDAESNEKIFRHLDGEDVQLTLEEVQVAGEIKEWLAEWADRLGMSKDNRISDYITHIFPIEKGGEIPEEIAFLINKKIPGSVYNPFLLQRKGAEGYIKDTWRALDAYVKRATRKVNMDPALAELKEASAHLTDTSQLNYLNRYLGAVNLRPTELDTVIDNHIKERFGFLFGARPTAAITRFMRKMVARAKIGGSVTSFAKNLTQGVNTFADLGTFYTTKGYMDLVKFGGKELNENGVLIAPFIEDRTYSAVKKVAEKFDDVLFLNMNASELVNRGAAYYGAKAKFLANKITPKEYKKAFGKEKPANYTPTMEEAIQYGKFVAAKTQFLFGALDTPVALNSDIAKMVAQFQTFGLKQAEYVMSMVGDKEYKKFLRYMIGSMMLFQFIGSAFGMKWDDSFKTLRFGIPPAVKFFTDLWKTLITGEDRYGNKLDSKEKAQATGKTLFTNVVPAGAQLERTFTGLGVVGEGADRTKAGNLKYKVDQTPENYLRGGLFGKYNLPESKQYYKEKEDKQKGKTKSSGRNKYNAL